MAPTRAPLEPFGRAIVIAVDGPAASGKGTIARALAAHFDLPHMDSGLLYRAVALNLLQTGGDPESEFAATRACDISQTNFSDPELKSEGVGGIASRISTYSAVRAALLERQQAFARQTGGAVIDGRDIGTVIAPEADVKLFVTASVEARAERRWKEMHERGQDVALADIAADIRRRDDRDANRADAPLRVAQGAYVIDNSAMTREQAIAAAIEAVESARSR